MESLVYRSRKLDTTSSQQLSRLQRHRILDVGKSGKMLTTLLRCSLITSALSISLTNIAHRPVSAWQILTPNISVLQSGDAGVKVEALQEELRELGYSLSLDGVYGSTTEQAVRQFQISQGLTADGIYGPATESALFGHRFIPASTGHTTSVASSAPLFGTYVNVAAGSRNLKLGDRGSDVAELQRLLNRRGFDAGMEDGTFGRTYTLSAVRSFQRSQGLNVDGVVGPATWCALGICNAEEFPATHSFPASGFVQAATGEVETPLTSILSQGRFVVVVPGNDISKLARIESELGRRAFLTQSDRGTFMTPGGYNSYHAAHNDMLRLRAADLDARVEFFN